MRKHRSPVIAFAALPSAQSPQSPSRRRPRSAAAGCRDGELLPDEQIQQVLNRLTFGARPGDAEKVRAHGHRQVDRPAAASRSASTIRATDALHGDVSDLQHGDRRHHPRLQRRAAAAASGEEGRRAATRRWTRRTARRELLRRIRSSPKLARQTQQFVGQVQSAKLARAVTTERQLDEVMVDFWENHFSVFAGKGQTRLFLTQYDRDVIRPHALGKFRDLLGAVAQEPGDAVLSSTTGRAPPTARIRRSRSATADARRRASARRIGARRPADRLGGQLRRAARRLQNATPEQRAAAHAALQQQAKRGLNENYARELMELHTLGVDGGYTQKDVQEVARALTGWTFNRQTGEFVFNPNMHDAGEKTVLGHKFAGGSRRGGRRAGARHRRARSRRRRSFITTKLARHFVSDDPPPALVDRCANDVHEDRRRHSRDAALHRHVAGVLQPRRVSRQGEDAVRGRGVSALRAVDAQPDTTPRTAQIVGAARPADLRPSDARRLARSRRRVDEHRRDPQSHQLRPEPRRRVRCRARSSTNWPQFDALRALPRDAAGGRRGEGDARRTGVAGDARGADERRESDAART